MPPFHRVVPHTGLAAGEAALAAAPAPRFILVTASPDEARGGAPWCPDAARAAPGVRGGVAAVAGSLLEVEVGRRGAAGGGTGQASRREAARK